MSVRTDYERRRSSSPIRLVLGMLVGLSAGACTAGYIERQIDEANFCDVTEDCAQAERSCEFECEVFVNRSELSRINELMRKYDRRQIGTCRLACPVIPPVCEEGQCVAGL